MRGVYRSLRAVRNIMCSMNSETAGGNVTESFENKFLVALCPARNCDGADFAGEYLQKSLGGGHEGEVSSVGDREASPLMRNCVCLRWRRHSPSSASPPTSEWSFRGPISSAWCCCFCQCQRGLRHWAWVSATGVLWAFSYFFCRRLQSMLASAGSHLVVAG